MWGTPAGEGPRTPEPDIARAHPKEPAMDTVNTEVTKEKLLKDLNAVVAET